MMLAGEESLRMLIREPSDQLIEFIKANLDDEDTLLKEIPRYEIPKSDFENQVLREMRVVLKDNISNIETKTNEELMTWTEFDTFYNTLENFAYPHKDKLLEFIKYFFLDHIVSAKKVMINFSAFKEYITAKKQPMSPSEENTRNASALKSGSRRMSQDSAGSAGDEFKKRMF